jgi:hypothetical protein
MQVKMDTYIYFVSLLVFNLILWNFRPRSSWPDFYRTNVTETIMNRGRTTAIVKQPILTFTLSNEELFET